MNNWRLGSLTDFYLWDAHAHIQSPWFSEQEINQLLIAASKQSIEGIVNVVSSPIERDYQEGIEIANKYPIIHTNFGLQPTEATNDNFSNFYVAVSNFKTYLCAIGEVGLDYYWVKDPTIHELQKEIFKKCIAVANDTKLPLVVHSRKAEDDCLDILEKEASVPVLMHGMEANDQQIKRLIDLNYFITIPTSVCIRKKYKKIAIKTPLEHILLETDSPFQLPFNPPAGEKVKNIPANINLSAKRIAEVKDLTLEDVATTTTKNTKTFFNISL